MTLDDSLGRVIIIIGPAKHRAVFMQEFIYLRREMVEKASGQADGSPGWSALQMRGRPSLHFLLERLGSL